MRFGGKAMKVVGVFVGVMILCSCNLVSAEKKKEKTTKTQVSQTATKAQDSKQVEQKLVKVSTLGSVEANQEFQKNVQIMQMERQRVIQLQNQLKQTQTKELKAGLEKELAAAMKKLNADNKKMVETYGFSLNRNYVLVVEKAHIYMTVSDDENKKIVAEEKKVKK